MSSESVAPLIVVLTLASVLLTSGIAKLRDPVATRDAFDALRIPPAVPHDPSAKALPWVEIVLAVLLVATPAGWMTPVAVAVLLLMLSYTWIVARALGFDEPVTCSCFGNLGRHDIDRTTLGRNVLLSALGTVIVWFAADGGSAANAFGVLDAGGWWTLLAATAAAAVAVLVVGGPSTRASASDDTELLDYERQPIPYGVVTGRDGTSSTLVELAATQARLLVMLNPGCGPCVRTAVKLDDWAGQLAPAVGVVALYPDQASADAAGEHAAELGMTEPERNVRRLFATAGTPAAVLLGADGSLAGGPVVGEDKVEDFVADVLSALSEEPQAVE